MIREEMKKILTGRKLLLILAVTVMYYLLFLSPYVNVNPGSYHQEAEIAKKIKETYGIKITPKDYEQMKKDVPFEGKELLDEIAEKSPLFREKGIRSMKELVLDEELKDEDREMLWDAVYKEFGERQKREDQMQGVTDTIELTYWSYYLEMYRNEILKQPEKGTVYYGDLSDKQEQRVRERNEKEVYAALPENVIRDNLEVLQFVAALMIISVSLLLAPYMVRENRSNMLPLQYSFRKGRRYYWIKFAAALFSAAFVIAADLLIYIGTAKINEVLSLADVPVSGYAGGFIGWFPWTLGTLSMAAAGLSVLAAFGAGCIVFAVTSYCANYITAIAC